VFTVSAGSATGGTFTLTVDGTVSDPIAWNAVDTVIIAAFPALFVNSVTGTGPWVVTFATPPTTSVTIDPTGLTQEGIVPVADASAAAAPTHTYNVSAGSATGGTFTLTVDGTTSNPIAWNAASADIIAAFPAGFVTAVIDTAGTGPWAITFAAGPNAVTINPAGLTYPASVGATATAYGGVDAVAVVDGGLGYTNPVVDFDFPNDPNGIIAKAHAVMDGSGTITAVVVDDPGSGYASAPNVVIRDGPIYAPVNTRLLNAAYAARDKVLKDKKAAPLSAAEVAAIGTAASTSATATATLKILYVTVNTFGSGYTSAPSVDITDPSPTVTKATATATVDAGGVTLISVTANGSGYITSGGIQKFTDPLPDLCDPATAGCAAEKYIPLGVPEPVKYSNIAADQYEIGLVQYRTSFNSSLPDTLVRGYVQLETTANAGISQHFALYNEMLDGTKVYVGCETTADCPTQIYGVTSPQWLGPTLVTTKNKPVRIIFRNLLPAGSGGNLFMPVDTTLMGSGMGPTGMWAPTEDGTVLDEVRNPLCTEIDPVTGEKIDMCFKDNRATLHLHGGISPWISDGTPHQWITPANEQTPWPQGVSVGNVPDMAAAGCDATDDGCMTFYYTNQQSARLQFYHDHSYGITRLNVLAGGAAGYVIGDETEKTLIDNGTIPGPADTKLLVIQDRTFVPQDTQMYNVDVNGKLPWETGYDPTQIASYGQDPTWDASRWGGYGNTWYHHVYMPAQNPGDPSGMSAFGRWMYGPWFWPPAANTVYGPIANPYYNKDPNTGFTTDLATPCNLDDPTTWQYQTDPFCEPELIPGTPNISVGMEQFNDTPIVNGVAYPTITLEPKTYRFRMLNAANDRFFNFQWYVADPNTASTSLNAAGEIIGGTEVAFNPAELAAAQLDPNIFPTPNLALSPAGPDWIQIGNEGGFLPAPAVIDGQQFTTWIIDPTRFDVGNVDLHSLLLAPAERADVIVDFSQFAGQTLILYNDGPAAFPARVASYDYYTGAADLSPVGAPTILPGYGPNTRTVMQVKIAGTPASAFNLAKLQNAFSHKANLTGVFESGQHPIIVGQAAYNSAYGTSFASGSCSTAVSGATQSCDGFVRVNDTASFNFNTLMTPSTVMTIPLEPKAIHDEMNATTFDEYGRMQATLGMEAQPPSPGVQNATLYPYVNPQTELIDATNLPKNVVFYDEVTGLPVSDVKITPISNAADGTQIWRITHNGVDTHPVHFHLFDVQTLNRVTWDNIILPPETSELGWKETLRVSPLEDSIVALRPIIPQLPWELPNAVRNLNPAMPTGATAVFNNVDPQGNPTNPIVNQLVNFGWEYVYHCHILSHEEMDMMRPVSAAMPPVKADGLTWSVKGNSLILTWTDNSIAETSYVVQRMNGTGVWADLPNPVLIPLTGNTSGNTYTYTDTTFRKDSTVYSYRVSARNTVGYGAEFPTMTAHSESDPVVVFAAPTNLAATLLAGPQVRLTWIDNSWNETGFAVERSTDGVTFTRIATAPAHNNTGSVTFTDTTTALGTTYTYRVAAEAVGILSTYSNNATITVAVPAAPSNVTASAVRQGTTNNEFVTLTWTDNSTNESSFQIQRATDAAFTTGLNSVTVAANITTYTSGPISRVAYYYRIRAVNVLSTLPYTWVNATPFPLPVAP